jgi:hypothetical protein
VGGVSNGVELHSLHLGLSGWRSLSVKTSVNLALNIAGTERPPMQHESLRLIIRAKLRQGLLPYNHIPRIWGAPSAGETCDACDSMIDPSEMVMEGISVTDGSHVLHTGDRRRPLQLHVTCFYLWDVERRHDGTSDTDVARGSGRLADHFPD